MQSKERFRSNRDDPPISRWR